jgi:hypothetical protein
MTSNFNLEFFAFFPSVEGVFNKTSAKTIDFTDACARMSSSILIGGLDDECLWFMGYISASLREVTTPRILLLAAKLK